MAEYLEEKLHDKIRALCAKGDALVTERQFEKAFFCYRDALNLLPDPAEKWEAATWILAAIGDLYFAAGKIDKLPNSDPVTA